jgi:hypothetical protein
MQSNPAAEIDWKRLKDEAAAPTRVALDHLERLARATMARQSVYAHADLTPPASSLALAVGLIATVRVLFAIGAAIFLPQGVEPAVPRWVMSTAAMVFTAGGITLWVGGVRDWRARHLGLAYLTMGGAFVNVHLTEVAVVGSSTIAALALLLKAFVVESFVAFFVLAFLETFPRVSGESTAQRAVTAFKRIALFFGIVLAIVNAVAWLWPLATGSTTPLPSLRRWLPSSTGQSLFWIVALAPLVPAPVLMFARARHSRGEERHRAQLLIAGVCLGVGPFVAVLIAAGVTGWFADPARTRAAAAVAYSALFTLPLTTAYAVLARGALDLRLLARTAAHHALAWWVLTSLTVVPLAVTMLLAYDYRTESLESLLAMPFARALLVTATVALVLTTARTRVLRGLDRLFLRASVDTSTLVTDIGEHARRLPTARDVAVDLAATMVRVFTVERADVLILDRRKARFEAIEGGVLPLQQSSALVDLAASGEDVLTTEQPTPLAGLLPYDDQVWLASTHVEALVPLHGRGDRLLGLLALGHRHGDWTYTARERRILKAVASAVSPVLERHLEAQSGDRSQSGAGEAALLMCVDCGVINSGTARQCACGGRIEGGVIPRVVGGKYEVTRRLGRGAMGVVYEARDLALERLVAIKALTMLSYSEGERLVQEAKRMTRVTHPNLAYVIGLETFNTMPLVVMEHLAGRTLRDRIGRGPLPLSEVTRIGMALCDALGRLHQAGLLHRDIKPGNIGFDGEGTPKLLDFGLALPVDSTRAPGASLAGTPLYLPPEAWQGQSANHHVDLWGLSMTLCEALLGFHPLVGVTPEELQGGAAGEAAERAEPHLPAEANAFFSKALARQPDHRFQDAAALRSALATASSMAGPGSGSTEQTT